MTTNNSFSFNAKLLSLVSSYRNGNQKAFNSLYSLLSKDAEATARHYALYNEGRGNFYEDYLSVAREGLWQAASSFNEEKGLFRTYAKACMANAIKAFIKEGQSVIGVKAHVAEDISRINKAEKALYAKGILYPSLEELSAESGITSLKTLQNALDAREALKLTALDKSFGDGEGEEDSFLSLFSDPTSLTEEDFLKSEEEKSLRSSILRLPPVDRTIIVLSYGLYDYKKCTNKEICRKVGLSEVSVIHHRDKALAILRGELEDWVA